MSLVRRFLLLAFALVAGLWLWSLIFPSPEKVIRKHLEKTARAASFKANEAPLERIGNIAEFANCFAPEVELKLDTPVSGGQSMTSRNDIMRFAGAARNQTSALQVEFLDPSLRLAADKQTAAVDLTVRARVPGDRDYFIQEMKFYLKKNGRGWLIYRVESVKTLSAAY